MTDDRDSTISQFRDLVTSLNRFVAPTTNDIWLMVFSEIDMLRTQQAFIENEKASSSKEAQTMRSLNMKLQSNVSRTQSRAIDIELDKIQAAQLADQTELILVSISIPDHLIRNDNQPFLPTSYGESEAPSINLYLLLRRILATTQLVYTTLAQIYDLPRSLDVAFSTDLVGICKIRGNLQQLGNAVRRCTAVMSRSTPDSWLDLGRLLPDISSAEARTQTWVERLKRDAFEPRECAQELSGLLNQFNHLADSAFNQPTLDAPEQQLGMCVGAESDLESLAASLASIRHLLAGVTTDDDLTIDARDDSVEDVVLGPIAQILEVSGAMGANLSEVITTLKKMCDSSKSFGSDIATRLQALTALTSQVATITINLAQEMDAQISFLRGAKQALRVDELHQLALRVIANGDDPDLNPKMAVLQSVIAADHALRSLTITLDEASDDLVSVHQPPPWLARALAIQDSATFSVENEKKSVRLAEDLKDMAREIKMRDRSLQEAGVKVETLERRLEGFRKQADMILELENDVAKAKKQEKVYEEAIEQLQAEQDALEAENEKLRKGDAVGNHQAPSSPLRDNHPSVSATESAHLHDRIEALRSALRFVRRENAVLKSKEHFLALRSLGPVPSLPMPELIPSSPTSSTSESSFDLTPPRPTRRAIDTGSKLLWRDITDFHAKAKIVDISQLNNQAGWTSRKNSPEAQMAGWRKEERVLRAKVEKLEEMTRMYAAAWKKG